MMAASPPLTRLDAAPRQRRNAYINVEGRPLTVRYFARPLNKEP
jgi:hypothetical protein